MLSNRAWRFGPIDTVTPAGHDTVVSVTTKSRSALWLRSRRKKYSPLRGLRRGQVGRTDRLGAVVSTAAESSTRSGRFDDRLSLKDGYLWNVAEVRFSLALA